jgi:curved DNA-binding protein CbpA
MAQNAQKHSAATKVQQVSPEVAAAYPSSPTSSRPRPPSQPEATPRPAISTPPAAARKPPPPRRAAAAPATRSAATPRKSTPGQKKPANSAPPRKGALTGAQIDAKFASIDGANFYGILDITTAASQNDVQSAYFKLAKLWHPDRLSGDLEQHRSQVAKVFAKISEAYQTLNDPAKREEYDGLVEHGGGTGKDRDIIERALDAGVQFQKAEVLFKKGEYVQAELLMKQAADADPENLEYKCMLAWVAAHRKGPPDDDAKRKTHYRDQILMLNEVVEADRQYAQAVYYRGELLKRSGLTDRAIKDFRKVLQLDPRNIDAAREVRVFDMRRKKDQKDPGLFGRLFNKKK